MTPVLRRRGFALLWAGDLLSMAGDWALLTAVPFYVYGRTGSTLATGLTFLVQFAPRMLLGPVAGVIADRTDQRRLLVTINLLQIAALAPLITVVGGPIWPVYIVLLMQVSLAQFAVPAFYSLLPRMVAPGELVSANGLLAASENAARLAGPALGGALLAVAGLEAVILFDAATFVAASASVWLISSSAGQDLERRTSAPIWRDLVEGMRTILAAPAARLVFLVNGVVQASDGLMAVMLAPFISTVLRADASFFGLLLSARGLSGLITGVAVSNRGALISPTRVITVAPMLIGLTLVWWVTFPSPEAVLVGVLLVGIPGTALTASSNALLQSPAIPDRFRGRIFGSYWTALALCGLGGTSIGTAAGDVVGVTPVLYAAGVVAVVGGLMSAVLQLHRTIRPEPATLATVPREGDTGPVVAPRFPNA